MRRHREHNAFGGYHRTRYEESSVNDKLIFKLRDLNHILRSLYEGRGSQSQVLIVLLKSGPMTQRDLTQRLGIQPGSASEVIGKLESAGLVVRTPSQMDRRTADIMLTELGQARAREAEAQREHRHEEMFALLAEEEKAALLATLERLADDWESRYQR